METIISELCDSQELITFGNQKTKKHVNVSDFSKSVCAFRGRLNICQGELGIIIGTTQASVNRWERSKSLPEGTMRKKLSALMSNEAVFKEILAQDNGIALAAAILAMHVNLENNSLQDTVRLMKSMLKTI